MSELACLVNPPSFTLAERVDVAVGDVVEVEYLTILVMINTELDFVSDHSALGTLDPGIGDQGVKLGYWHWIQLSKSSTPD